MYPPEPPGYWKFKLVAGAAVIAAFAGGSFALQADLATSEGIARAATGAAAIALSIAGFLYYWRSI